MGESIVYAIKTAIIVVAVATFTASLFAITSTIMSFASNSVLGEALGLISVFLPFNAGTVFASIVSAFNVILIWVIARKIFELTLRANEAT